MSRFIRLFVFTLLLGSLLLAACAPAATPAPAATAKPVEVTRIVEGTPKTVVITATPAPATAAPSKAPNLAAGSVQLNGQGATFPLPVYTQWIYAYQYVDPSVTLNYQGTGSGAGKKAIIDGTVDFAGSDSLVTDAEYTAGKDLQMLPMLAGAVVTVYNLADLPATPALVLDRPTLVAIYNAKIKTWDDPAILALNPELKDKLTALKKKDITVVHRSDGSGTTEIFTKALAAFSPDWKAGAASAVEWPVDKAGNGIGGKGNQGVAAAVLNTPGAIGYVELSYAVSNKMPFASLINKAGKKVTANEASLAAAMTDFAASFTDKLTTDIVDGKGEGSWPIAGYTYLIVKMKDSKDCTKAAKLAAFINWALTDKGAAKGAADLGYAVLPKDVQTKVLAKLGEMTCSGKPVLTK